MIGSADQNSVQMCPTLHNWRSFCPTLSLSLPFLHVQFEMQMEMWRWYWQVLFAGWHLSPADWCDWARQRDRGFLQTVLCKWSYPSLKNLFHICNRWLANPKTSFWKAKSPTGTGALRKWSAEFFFVICKFVLKSAQMSPFVRNGGMEPSDGEKGGRVEFGSWAALNAKFDKILF